MSEARGSSPKRRKKAGGRKKKELAPTPEVVEEKRMSKRFGTLALATAFVSFGSVLAQLSAVDPRTKGKVEDFRDYDSAMAVLSTGLRVLSLVMLLFVGKFFFDAIRRRTPGAPDYALWLGIIAVVCVIVASVANTVSFHSVVNEFLDLPVREQTDARADDLLDDDIITRLSPVLGYGSAVLFAGWILVICSGAVGVGLMPRFVAYFGYGVALMQVIGGAFGSAFLVGWVATVGLLMLDLWPGGRPKAWETGRAEPLTW